MGVSHPISGLSVTFLGSGERTLGEEVVHRRWPRMSSLTTSEGGQDSSTVILTDSDSEPDALSVNPV